MANTIQIKRGLYASLPVLAEGELGFSTDTKQLHIGDGSANHEVVMADLFDAYTFLFATNDNTPAAITRAQMMQALTGQATDAFSMHGHKITSLADPSLAQDAATKAYADGIAGGVDPKDSCRVATTAALPACTASDSGVGKTLTADAIGVLTVDGVATVLSDRILVKDQAAGADNGIYKVTTEGTSGVAYVLTRATDFDEDAEVTGGAYCFIAEGTANADQGWILTTNDPITVDTTALTFSQFSGSGGAVVAGTGMTKSGDTLNVIGGTGITANADDIAVDYGTTSTTACIGNDARLSDARTPTAHASSHITGQSDAIQSASTAQNGLATSTHISAIAANTAKETNATHTGDVTGATALTIADDAVTYAKMQNVAAAQRVLGNIAGAGSAVAEIPIGIADNNIVQIDDTAVAENEYAMFSTVGLHGIAATAVLLDLTGKAIAAFDMNNQKITSLADPTSAQHAATQNYCDTRTIDGGAFA